MFYFLSCVFVVLFDCLGSGFCGIVSIVVVVFIFCCFYYIMYIDNF
jgi:hypothetical protein